MDQALEHRTGLERHLGPWRAILLIGAGVLLWLLLSASNASAQEGPLGIGEVVDSATDATSEVAETATDTAGEVAETASDTTSEVAETATDTAGDVTESVDSTVGAVVEVASNAVDTTLETATGTLADVGETATGLVSDLGETATGLVSDVGETATGIVRTTRTVEQIAPVEPVEPVPAPVVVARGPAPDDDVAPASSNDGGRRLDHRVVAAPAAADATSDAPRATSTNSPATDSPEGIPGHAPAQPAASGPVASARDSLRVGSSSTDAAVLATILLLALVLARWPRRENEHHLSPIFLSLAERPG